MNAYGRTIDKTFLSVDNAEERGFLHRDYIAHCFRWTHVVKRLAKSGAYKNAVILDIGAGKEIPFAKMLYSSRMIPKAYYGVDAGTFKAESISLLKGEMAQKSKFFPNTDFLCKFNEEVSPSHIIMFEVLEHVEPKHGLGILRKVKKMLPKDGLFFLSTPCWDGTTAKNHVNEINYHALGAVLGSIFTIEEVYGTFASISDYKHLLESFGIAPSAFEKLREYYDTNVLSTIFAPVFPQYSRNALWVLSNRPGLSKVNFGPISMVPAPWGSSEKWQDLAE